MLCARRYCWEKGKTPVRNRGFVLSHTLLWHMFLVRFYRTAKIGSSDIIKSHHTLKMCTKSGEVVLRIDSRRDHHGSSEPFLRSSNLALLDATPAEITMAQASLFCLIIAGVEIVDVIVGFAVWGFWIDADKSFVFIAVIFDKFSRFCIAFVIEK